MKKHFAMLLVFAFAIFSCNRNDDLYDEFIDDSTWIDDSGSDDDQDSGEEGSLTLYEVRGDVLVKVKDYAVPSHLLPYQQNQAKHQQMWEFVTRLIPLEERGNIAEFEVFHGGDDLAGYVSPLDENDLSQWRFGLAIDIAEKLESIDFQEFFTLVTIHEYGHVLTLNDRQVRVSNPDACNNFFTGEGCSNPNSYINRLFELGWKDIFHEWDEENPEKLYDKYPNRFVSEYAATNPGEDIAEVFTFFVARANRPNGNTLADQKINLLYEFPELVEVRRKMRNNAVIRSARSTDWIHRSHYKNVRICNRKGCTSG